MNLWSRRGSCPSSMVYVSRCCPSSFFMLLRRIASPMLSLVGSRELLVKTQCLRIYFHCFQFVSSLGKPKSLTQVLQVSFKRWEIHKWHNSSCKLYFTTIYLFPPSHLEMIIKMISFIQTNSFWDVIYYSPSVFSHTVYNATRPIVFICTAVQWQLTFKMAVLGICLLCNFNFIFSLLKALWDSREDKHCLSK